MLLLKFSCNSYESPFSLTSISKSLAFLYAVYHCLKTNNTNRLPIYSILPFYPLWIFFLFGLWICPGFLSLPDSFRGQRNACGLDRDWLLFIWSIRLVDRSFHNYSLQMNYTNLFFCYKLLNPYNTLYLSLPICYEQHLLYSPHMFSFSQVILANNIGFLNA